MERGRGGKGGGRRGFIGTHVPIKQVSIVGDKDVRLCLEDVLEEPLEQVLLI